MTTYWPYIVAFLSPVLSFLSAYAVLRINRSHADGQKQREGEDSWRKARLAKEVELEEKIKASESARMKWELENNADLEHVAGILDRFVDVQEKFATMAEQQKWHGKELTRHDDELKAVRADIREFQHNLNNHLTRHAQS